MAYDQGFGDAWTGEVSRSPSSTAGRWEVDEHRTLYLVPTSDSVRPAVHSHHIWHLAGLSALSATGLAVAVAELGVLVGCALFVAGAITALFK